MDMDVVPAVESTAVDAGPAARRELRAAQGFRGHGGRLVPAGTGEAVERGTPRVQERGRREGRARRGPSFSWAGAVGFVRCNPDRTLPRHGGVLQYDATRSILLAMTAISAAVSELRGVAR